MEHKPYKNKLNPGEQQKNRYAAGGNRPAAYYANNGMETTVQPLNPTAQKPEMIVVVIKV